MSFQFDIVLEISIKEEQMWCSYDFWIYRLYYLKVSYNYGDLKVWNSVQQNINMLQILQISMIFSDLFICFPETHYLHAVIQFLLNAFAVVQPWMFTMVWRHTQLYTQLLHCHSLQVLEGNSDEFTWFLFQYIFACQLLFLIVKW